MRWMSVLALGLAAAACAAQSGNAALAQAGAALQNGEADKALVLLQPLTASGSAQAEAHNLTCRVLLNLEQWDRAAGECERAVSLDKQNAEFHLWLGRALGERADRTSFMSAYSLGKRVHAEFEEAVRLSPKNAEALADLGEFNYSAPGVVGGGRDKAESVAAQLDHVDPARAAELRGHIHESAKDFDAAERDFKQAVAASQHPAFQWSTLASFYRRRERWNDLDAVVKNCLAAAQRDKTAGVALYNAASVLTRANRNPQLAVQLIESYLNGPRKTEEAPAFVAHTRLAKLKAQLGDRNAAQHERDAALTLAHDYKPARELKF